MEVPTIESHAPNCRNETPRPKIINPQERRTEIIPSLQSYTRCAEDNPGGGPDDDDSVALRRLKIQLNTISLLILPPNLKVVQSALHSSHLAGRTISYTVTSVYVR